MTSRTGIIYRILLPVFLAVVFLISTSPAQAQKQIQYYQLTPQEIVDTLKNTPGKKVLYIYAAYSPQSRETFSEMLTLTEKLHKEKHATVMAVSLDANIKDLDRLLNIYARIPFLPIVAVVPYKTAMRSALTSLGIRFDEAVPFFAVLDETNHILGQGIPTNEEILNLVLPPEKIIKKRTSVYDEEPKPEPEPAPQDAPGTAQEKTAP